MSMLLFLLSFPVAIAVWYFLVKKLKATGKGLSRHVTGFVAGFFAWLGICTIAVYSDPKEREHLAKANLDVVATEKAKQAQEQQKQEQLAQAQQNEQKQKAADEQSAEVQKLAELHQLSIQANNKADQLVAQIGNAFKAQDLYKAYASADELYALSRRQSVDIRPIELKNEEANKNVKNYVEHLSMLAIHRINLAELSKKVSDGGAYKPSDQMEMKKIANSIKSSATMAGISIMSAYDNLGVKPDQVDYVNGGLKK